MKGVGRGVSKGPGGQLLPARGRLLAQEQSPAALRLPAAATGTAGWERGPPAAGNRWQPTPRERPRHPPPPQPSSRSYFFSNSPVMWRFTKVVLPAEGGQRGGAVGGHAARCAARAAAGGARARRRRAAAVLRRPPAPPPRPGGRPRAPQAPLRSIRAPGCGARGAGGAGGLQTGAGAGKARVIWGPFRTAGAPLTRAAVAHKHQLEAGHARGRFLPGQGLGAGGEGGRGARGASDRAIGAPGARLPPCASPGASPRWWPCCCGAAGRQGGARRRRGLGREGGRGAAGAAWKGAGAGSNGRGSDMGRGGGRGRGQARGCTPRQQRSGVLSVAPQCRPPRASSSSFPCPYSTPRHISRRARCAPDPDPTRVVLAARRQDGDPDAPGRGPVGSPHGPHARVRAGPGQRGGAKGAGRGGHGRGPAARAGAPPGPRRAAGRGSTQDATNRTPQAAAAEVLVPSKQLITPKYCESINQTKRRPTRTIDVSSGAPQGANGRGGGAARRRRRRAAPAGSAACARRCSAARRPPGGRRRRRAAPAPPARRARAAPLCHCSARRAAPNCAPPRPGSTRAWLAPCTLRPAAPAPRPPANPPAPRPGSPRSAPSRSAARTRLRCRP
jgi:hypothetical protein